MEVLTVRNRYSIVPQETTQLCNHGHCISLVPSIHVVYRLKKWVIKAATITSTLTNLSLASCLSWYNSLSISKHARSISKFLCTSVFQLWEGRREKREGEGSEEREKEGGIITPLQNWSTVSQRTDSLVLVVVLLRWSVDKRDHQLSCSQTTDQLSAHLFRLPLPVYLLHSIPAMSTSNSEWLLPISVLITQGLPHLNDLSCDWLRSTICVSSLKCRKQITIVK